MISACVLLVMSFSFASDYHVFDEDDPQKMLVGTSEDSGVFRPGFWGEFIGLSETDLNLFIKPDSGPGWGYTYLATNPWSGNRNYEWEGVPGTDWRIGMVECEVDYKDEFEVPGLTTPSAYIGKRTWVIGPWVEDGGHDDKTEIQPIDAIIWELRPTTHLDQSTTLYMINAGDDDSGRFNHQSWYKRPRRVSIDLALPTIRPKGKYEAGCKIVTGHPLREYPYQDGTYRSEVTWTVQKVPVVANGKQWVRIDFAIGHELTAEEIKRSLSLAGSRIRAQAFLSATMTPYWKPSGEPTVELRLPREYARETTGPNQPTTRGFKFEYEMHLSGIESVQDVKVINRNVHQEHPQRISHSLYKGTFMHYAGPDSTDAERRWTSYDPELEVEVLTDRGQTIRTSLIVPNPLRPRLTVGFGDPTRTAATRSNEVTYSWPFRAVADHFRRDVEFTWRLQRRTGVLQRARDMVLTVNPALRPLPGDKRPVGSSVSTASVATLGGISASRGEFVEVTARDRTSGEQVVQQVPIPPLRLTVTVEPHSYVGSGDLQSPGRGWEFVAKPMLRIGDEETTLPLESPLQFDWRVDGNKVQGSTDRIRMGGLSRTSSQPKNIESLPQFRTVELNVTDRVGRRAYVKDVYSLDTNTRNIKQLLGRYQSGKAVGAKRSSNRAFRIESGGGTQPSVSEILGMWRSHVDRSQDDLSSRNAGRLYRFLNSNPTLAGRSEQKEEAKGSGKKTRSESPAAEAFTGTWEIEKKQVLVLERTGDSVKGEFLPKRIRFDGTVKGAVLTFRWQDGRRSGIGTLTIVGDRLEGYWNAALKADRIVGRRLK